MTVARRPAAGETVSGADFTTAAGGKGGNQAAAAARLGGDVRLLARLGADVEGQRMRALLEDSGVDVAAVRAVHGARTGAAFVTVTPDGENTIVVAPGSNLALSAVDVDGAVHLISAASVLVLQLEVPVETVIRAAELAPADTRVLLNLAPAAEKMTCPKCGQQPVYRQDRIDAALAALYVKGADSKIVQYAI